MALEGARGGELTELVSDHVLSAVDRNELAAVVHGDGMADHVGMDGGAAAVTGSGVDTASVVAAFFSATVMMMCAMRRW